MLISDGRTMTSFKESIDQIVHLAKELEEAHTKDVKAALDQESVTNNAEVDYRVDTLTSRVFEICDQVSEEISERIRSDPKSALSYADAAIRAFPALMDSGADASLVNPDPIFYGQLCK